MLTPKKMAAIKALLTCQTKTEAAALAGISARTMSAYLQDEEFQKEYGKASRQLITEAARQGQRYLSPALEALFAIVRDKNESAQTRVSAARSLLEYGLRLTEFADIVEVVDSDVL